MKSIVENEMTLGFGIMVNLNKAIIIIMIKIITGILAMDFEN